MPSFTLINMILKNNIIDAKFNCINNTITFKLTAYLPRFRSKQPYYRFYFYFREVNKHDVERIMEKFSNKNILKPLNVKNENNEASSLIISSSEITSCEDYEIVQNLMHKLIREIKRDSETIEYMTRQLKINNEDCINNNFKTHLKSSLNYSKSRSKSPRPVFNSTNKSNTSINETLLLQTNSSTNNESSSNNSSLKNVDIANGLAIANQTNSQSYPNMIANTSTKKQSSKFPFFTKILNK